MGADQSAFDQPLQPQPVPVCGTEPRFCLPNPVQLKLKEKFFSLSGDDFKIADASDSSIIYFQCRGSVFSLRDKKVLLDNQGNAVLTMKEALMSFTDKFRIYAGDGSGKEICKFNSRITFLKAKLVSKFPDSLNPSLNRHLVLKGDWREKRCVIYLGEPKQGGVPVARIYRPLTGRSYFLGADEYIIEISAGVDIALCVIMCIALDEHAREG